MKPSGRHPDRALTPLKVRALKAPGRYTDGNGLYLLVDQRGAKRWVLRTLALGRRRDIGLGSTLLVPLVEAREAARQWRKIAREGGDPIAARRKAKYTAVQSKPRSSTRCACAERSKSGLRFARA